MLLAHIQLYPMGKKKLEQAHEALEQKHSHTQTKIALKVFK